MTEIPFGYVKDGKIYRKGWAGYPDREIGEVRNEDVEKSSDFFQERFNDLSKKVQDVTSKIDNTANKGSFLMKLVHLKDQLSEHDGLGDYQTLWNTIDKYESLVKEIIQKNRKRNSEIKSALIEEANQLEDIISWKEATEKAHDVKTRWIKTGSAEEEKNEELENAFWEKVTQFYDKKKQFYEDKQKLVDYRKRQYEKLLKEAEKLAELHGKVRFDRVKELKEKWKETGGIPADFYQPLHDSFQKALKGKKKQFVQPLNYKGILEKLERVKLDKEPLIKKELDTLKKLIYKDRFKSEEKNKTLEFIQLLLERDFVIKLANKHFPDFHKMVKEKKKGIKKGIIKDLIQRDTEDLKIYEENSANFSSSDGSMNKLFESKIKGQKRKIEIKTTLLEGVEKGEF
ncbi:MAG: DUF349 domain-containing protein [Bacteroidota bacterium]